MTIRPVRSSDRAELVRMRTSLWPDSTAAEVDELLRRPFREYAVLVAEPPDGRGLCGFAEAGTRPYAEGCLTSPVGYLEGIWVDREQRRSKVGEGLVRAVEAWVRELGLLELASDTEMHNETSQVFHAALGFDVAERIVCFRKDLRDPGARGGRAGGTG